MPGLRITILGSGTSQGVPMIACDCAVCTSTDPRDKRTRSSILVETPEASWVVDTGADFRHQALRENIRHLDAILYTHAHTDHVMGFDDLRRFCNAPERGLPIHATQETMSDLRRIFAFAFSGEHAIPGYVYPIEKIVTGPFEIGKTRIVPVWLPHGRFGVTGYIFERDGEKLAAYFSDCNAVPPAAMEAAMGVKHLIIDGLRHRPHPTHCTITDALAAGAEMKAGHIWLTHICHEVFHAPDEAALPVDHAKLAYDGLRIEA